MAPCDCTPMARHRCGGGTIRRPAASRPVDDASREALRHARILLAGLAIAAGALPAVSRAGESSPALPATRALTTSAVQSGLVAASDTVTCASTAGERKACPANTSGGVA